MAFNNDIKIKAEKGAASLCDFGSSGRRTESVESVGESTEASSRPKDRQWSQMYRREKRSSVPSSMSSSTKVRTTYNEIHMPRTVDPQPRSERDHHYRHRHNLRIKEGRQKRCVPRPRAAVTVLRRCHQHHVPRPRIPTASFRLPNASNSRASAPRPASPHLSRELTRGRV